MTGPQPKGPDIDRIRRMAQAALDREYSVLAVAVRDLACIVERLAERVEDIAFRLESHEKDICQHIAPIDQELPVIHNPGE